MLEARTISISIDRNWRHVCEAEWRQQDFSRWVSGLSRSPIEKDGDEWWRAEGPDGQIRTRFTDHNGFGIMDHYVDIDGGAEIYVPMRIVPNGEGAEVLLTLFRQPGMSDETFTEDAEWVARDLAALRSAVAA